MASDEFDCTVIGDEPAGLWLLSQAEQRSRAAGTPFQGAWFRLEDAPPAVPFPARLASLFGIEAGPVWHAEILAPTDHFLWEEKALESRFQGLSVHDLNANPIFSKASRRSMASEVIRKHPDLYLSAVGVWKALGRTDRVSPETMLLGALLGTDLFHWAPSQQMPSALSQWTLDPTAHPLEEVKKLRSGNIFLKFRGQEPLTTKKLILNAPLSRLVPFFRGSPEWLKILELDTALLSPMAQYPFSVQVDRTAVPAPVRPLSVVFDTSGIADVTREVWPIHVHPAAEQTALTFWVSGPRDVPLEFLEDRFRQGVQRLSRLFPFLRESVKHFSLPLEMTSCFSFDDRRHWMDVLERRSVESYEMIRREPRTRWSRLYVLSPFVHCHLPYPLGPMHAAQQMLRDWFGRRSQPTSVEAAPHLTA